MIKTMKIVVADDHVLVRQQVGNIIKAIDRFELAGVACNGLELLQLVEAVRPDLAIVDMYMPEMSGIEAVREIKKQFPQTKIVLLTLYYSEIILHECMRLGVSGYVVKEDSGDDLVQVLSNADFEGICVSTGVMDSFLKQSGGAHGV